mgnify:CR=1 FL=1
MVAGDGVPWLTHRAVGVHPDEHGRHRGRAAVEVEPEVADVGAAGRIDDHVVAVERRERREVREGDERTVPDPQHAPVPHRDDEEVPVRVPAEARRPLGHLDDRAHRAVRIDREHPGVVHVAEDEATLVPPGSLREPEALDEDGRGVGACGGHGAQSRTHRDVRLRR